MNKQIFILIIGMFFLLNIPVGQSDCGCNNSDYQITNNIIGDNAAEVYPMEKLCGLIIPDNWWSNASFDPCIPTRDLPETFDWRELGGTTSVKNQGPCGSCWAFATAGALECNILIKDGEEVDLSEQWLVSCNQNGWGCNGGWWAHDYHQWKTDSFFGTGAVLEKNFPYTASDVLCDGPYPHNYLIDSWSFVGFSGIIPIVDSIKQAIMDYGPISVAVAVDSAFGEYNGGVFSGNYTGINHAVVLVGWDDNQGQDGVWFLRNSWGPGWGENGYMRIEYGSNMVGYSACYVNYPKRTQIEIKGGLSLTLGIRNIGENDLNNIKWSISITGGKNNGVNRSLWGIIPTLQPNEVDKTLQLFYGLGPIKIIVTAEPSNAGRTQKIVKGFVIFGLVLPLFG